MPAKYGSWTAEDGGLPVCNVDQFKILSIANNAQQVALTECTSTPSVLAGLLLPVLDEPKPKGKRERPFSCRSVALKHIFKIENKQASQDVDCSESRLKLNWVLCLDRGET